MSENESRSNDADWGFVGFDFAKLVESSQIGGVDMMSLIDMERKNIDELIAVNRSAFESWQNLLARQTEVFQETMKAFAAEARHESGVGPRTEIARQGFEKALADMRHLAQSTIESQKQTIEILHRRFEDGMAAICNHSGKG